MSSDEDRVHAEHRLVRRRPDQRLQARHDPRAPAFRGFELGETPSRLASLIFAPRRRPAPVGTHAK